MAEAQSASVHSVTPPGVDDEIELRGESKVTATKPSKPVPPLHVHVDSNTPVHVHIRKFGAKNKSGVSKPLNAASELSMDSANEVRGPWIPPPAKNSRTQNLGDQPREMRFGDDTNKQEMDDVVAERVNRCTQWLVQNTCKPKHPTNTCRPTECCTTARPASMCPSDMRAGSDTSEFLRRTLSILRKEKQEANRIAKKSNLPSSAMNASGSHAAPSDVTTRTPAGQDMSVSLGRLTQLQQELEAIVPRLSALQASAKNLSMVEIMSSAEVKKRSFIVQRLTEVEVAQRALMQALGAKPVMDNVNGTALLQEIRSREQTNRELLEVLQTQQDVMETLKQQMSSCKPEKHKERIAFLQEEVKHKSTELEHSTEQLQKFQMEIENHLEEVKRLHAVIEQSTKANESEKQELRKQLNDRKAYTLKLEGELKQTIHSEQENQRLQNLEEEVSRLRLTTQAKDELEKVCQRLQVHLKELQPLPKMLKSTELKLQETQQLNMQHEQRINEQCHLVSGLINKFDEQTKLVEEQQKRIITQQERITELVKLDKDNLMTMTSLKDAIKLHDQSSNHFIEKIIKGLQEQQIQDRVKEVEKQLAISKQEVNQMKQEKLEMERKYGQHMQDLKEQLEQCDNATHSMQNYITYLKTSYASVFNDPTLMSGQ